MRFRILAVLLLTFGLAGCMTYRYAGETYKTRAEAEAAQRARLEEGLNGVERRSQPVADFARVTIPDMPAVLTRGVLPGGTEQARNYVATMLYNDYSAIVEAIKKRNLFEHVEVVQTPTPDQLTSANGRINIYLYLSSDRKRASWYYLSDKTPNTPLNFDKGSEWRNRYKFFLDSIEALAASEK